MVYKRRSASSGTADGLGTFGFTVMGDVSGLVMSRDVENSVFWMFLLVAEKTGDYRGGPFVSADFAFPAIRTPVTRVEKGERARRTILSERGVRHHDFRLLPLGMLGALVPGTILTYNEVRDLATA